MSNIEKLIIVSQDRNINFILEEILPFMTNLSEIHLDSKAINTSKRFEIIHKHVSGLKKLYVAEQFVAEARKKFNNCFVGKFCKNF